MGFIWIHRYLGKNFSYTLIIKPDHQLITSGPYRFIRHPMYSAFLIFHIAIFLISGNWFIGIIWIVGLLIIFLLRISKEEEMLLNKFSKQYREYQKRTGSLFLPIFKMLQKHKRKEIFDRKWIFELITYQKITSAKSTWFFQWLQAIFINSTLNSIKSFYITFNENSQRKMNLSEKSDFIEHIEIQKLKSQKLVEKRNLSKEENSNIYFRIEAHPSIFSLSVQFSGESTFKKEVTTIQIIGAKKVIKEAKTHFDNLSINPDNIQIVQYGP